MSRKDDIKKLLSNKVRRLQKLKEQQSVFGISTNPEILIEIEDLEGEIEELEKQLQPNEVEGPGDTNGGFDTPERNDRVFPCLARIYAKLRSPKLLYLGMGLVVVLLLIAGVRSLIPKSTYSTFCVRQSTSKSVVNDGAEIVVKPEEPMILSLCTADETPVSFQTCSWKSSSTGHFEDPNRCVDVIYYASASDPDILTLTVKDKSTAINKQLSLTVIVKP